MGGQPEPSPNGPPCRIGDKNKGLPRNESQGEGEDSGDAKGRFKTASHGPFHSAAFDDLRASVSDSPTQAQAQAVKDGPVAAVTLLNGFRAAVVEKDHSMGGV